MPPEAVPLEFAPFLEDFFVRAAQVRSLTLKWPSRVRKVYDCGISSIDPDRILALQGWIRDTLIPRFEASPSNVNLRQMPFKYLDVPATLKEKAPLIVDAGIDRAHRLRILDIGVGGGALAHLSQCFGHDVMGLDIPDPTYGQLLKAVGVQSKPGRIEAGEPAPIEGRFDLICATQIVFNKTPPDSSVGPNDSYWSGRDWIYFFKNLADHLGDGGRIFLTLNRQPHFQSEAAEADWILDWLASAGCAVSYSTYSVAMSRRQALGLNWSRPD